VDESGSCRPAGWSRGYVRFFVIRLRDFRARIARRCDVIRFRDLTSVWRLTFRVARERSVESRRVAPSRPRTSSKCVTDESRDSDIKNVLLCACLLLDRLVNDGLRSLRKVKSLLINY